MTSVIASKKEFSHFMQQYGIVTPPAIIDDCIDDQFIKLVIILQKLKSFK